MCTGGLTQIQCAPGRGAGGAHASTWDFPCALPETRMTTGFHQQQEHGCTSFSYLVRKKEKEEKAKKESLGTMKTGMSKGSGLEANVTRTRCTAAAADDVVGRP